MGIAKASGVGRHPNPPGLSASALQSTLRAVRRLAGDLCRSRHDAVSPMHEAEGRNMEEPGIEKLFSEFGFEWNMVGFLNAWSAVDKALPCYPVLRLALLDDFRTWTRGTMRDI